jgi:hypothetical protein
VPAPAWGEQHVSFPGRLVLVVGVDHAMTGEDDEELIGVGMTMSIVPGAWRQHCPTEKEALGPGPGLIDQELDLHVDPSLVTAQAAFDGHIVAVDPIPVAHDAPPSLR